MAERQKERVSKLREESERKAECLVCNVIQCIIHKLHYEITGTVYFKYLSIPTFQAAIDTHLLDG